MAFRDRLRVASEAPGGSVLPPRRDVRPASAAPLNLRHSNGLKDFMWMVGDVSQGRLLDLGPAWQSTVAFFTERGFRVTADDLLRSWAEHRRMAEKLAAEQSGNGNVAGLSDAASIAERFCQENLLLPAETFHGILAWDLFDYLDRDLLSCVVGRLYELLKPSGVLLAIFHGSPAERFRRYRVVDLQAIEIVATDLPFRTQRVFQNREILSLFGRFRSSRTYVGRDKLREALFTK